MSRVAAIALDAAEWTLIESLLERGQLPNLARIRGRSAACRLRNVPEYRAELPWTLFVTGRDAPDNRYWSTAQFDPRSYESYMTGAYRGRPFYALEGTKVVAFDVPSSVIAPDVDGVQITAWGAHSANYPRASRPAGLLREIDERFGPHPAFDNDYDGGWYQPQFIDQLSDALLVGASRRIDIARWLQQRYPDWDLFMTAMSETHSAGHHFWHGVADDHPLHRWGTAPLAERRLLEVYGALDEAVGRFAATLPDDAVLVVFAVHGMQSNQNDVPSGVLLPELLHRLQFGRGLLKDHAQRTWRQRGFPPVSPDPNRLWLGQLRDRFANGPADRLRRAARLATPLPVRRLKQALQGGRRKQSPILRRPIPPESDLLPEEIGQSRSSLAWQVAAWYRPYWPQMQAFALPTFSDAHVRLNVRGRESAGIVDLEDYERVCKEVEETVRACRNPRTGNPVVTDVVRMREDDPMDPEGPDSDLVIFWTEAIDAFEHPDVGTIGPFPFLRTGEHSTTGFAMFSGPGIEPGDLGEHHLLDLPATFVALLGRTPPPDLAGRPILAMQPAR